MFSSTKLTKRLTLMFGAMLIQIGISSSAFAASSGWYIWCQDEKISGQNPVTTGKTYTYRAVTTHWKLENTGDPAAVDPLFPDEENSYVNWQVRKANGRWGSRKLEDVTCPYCGYYQKSNGGRYWVYQCFAKGENAYTYTFPGRQGRYYVNATFYINNEDNESIMYAPLSKQVDAFDPL